VFIPLEKTPASFVVRSNEVQIPSQASSEGIAVLFDSLRANEKRTLTIYYNDNNTSTNETYNRKRTQATASRYGISAWESERICYRMPPNRLNKVDIFGKKTSDMVLMGVDDEEFELWAMMAMKGAIDLWPDTTDIKIANIETKGMVDGNLASSVLTKYYGWYASDSLVDVEATLSINAGSRLTKNTLVANEDIPLSAGIQKNKQAKVFRSEGSTDSWGYIATYGKQSLNNDKLGLVILFSPLNHATFDEDDQHYLIKLKTDNSKLEYHFGAAWELEPNGITSEADFIRWVERSARELANPITVHVK
jgi:hypothetical protein